MGWEYGLEDRRRPTGDQSIGETVIAPCDEAGCDVRINRGSVHICGDDIFGGTYGCGKFFCNDHLVSVTIDGRDFNLCDDCLMTHPEAEVH